MTEPNPDDERLLTARESQIILAVAEGLPLTSVAEIEGVEVAEVAAVCRRAMSVLRHPSAALDKATQQEIDAAAYIAEHPSVLAHQDE